MLTGLNDTFTNMAIDESVLIHRGKGEVPSTIRLYGRTKPAVTVGYFQNIEKTVDLEKCRELGVNVVRRMTGGGATFHDREMVYSCVVPESDPMMPRDVQESFRKICGGVIKGLSHLGIKSIFSLPNDIVVNGKKISGNAQTRKSHTILQQGTVLMDVDLDRMFSLLKVSSEKLKGKMIKDARERVTSIKNVLGVKLEFNEVCRALVKGFEGEFGIKLSEGKLTESELKLAEKIAKEKYSTEKWNLKR